MALINFDSDRDPWLSEYDSCERLQREIMEYFNQRNKERKNSDQYSRLSATIRLRMKQYTTEIDQLKIKNDLTFQRKSITAEEYERRMRQIESLESKIIHMNTLFNDHTKTKENRTQLFSNSRGQSTSVRELGVVDWGTGDEDDDPPIIGSSSAPNNYTIEDVKRTQQQILSEQDRGLEELSKIISRQKNIAETIHTEVDLQNEIIDDLAENVDRTNDRLRSETQNIRVIGRRDSTCGYWVIILSLFVCIVILAFI